MRSRVLSGRKSYLFIVLDLRTDILQRCVRYVFRVWVLRVRYVCDNTIGAVGIIKGASTKNCTGCLVYIPESAVTH
jgi:hypothetical protein